VEPLAQAAGTMSGQPAMPRPSAPDGASPQQGAAVPDGLTPPLDAPEPSFADRLALLRQDPGIRSFARRIARNRELADDALQEAYYAVSRVKDPTAIKDLRSYFCRAVRNQVIGMSRQPCPRPAAEIDTMLAATTSDGPHPSLHGSPCEASGIRSAQRARWLASITGPLTSEIPGRSDEPDRYRLAVAEVARWALEALMDGELSTADMNDLLISRHQEWFAAAGSYTNTCHQRLSRARRDAFTLLGAVISRDELRP
jgi:DNA-directed RNA polymerase specialized sigma24 family protein